MSAGKQTDYKDLRDTREIVLILCNPVGDVSILTHTCPHKSLRKIKVAINNHQVDGPFHL